VKNFWQGRVALGGRESLRFQSVDFRSFWIHARIFIHQIYLSKIAHSICAHKSRNANNIFISFRGPAKILDPNCSWHLSIQFEGTCEYGAVLIKASLPWITYKTALAISVVSPAVLPPLPRTQIPQLDIFFFQGKVSRREINPPILCLRKYPDSHFSYWRKLCLYQRDVISSCVQYQCLLWRQRPNSWTIYHRYVGVTSDSPSPR
jgi:hypothetical protein